MRDVADASLLSQQKEERSKKTQTEDKIQQTSQGQKEEGGWSQCVVLHCLAHRGTTKEG